MRCSGLVNTHASPVTCLAVCRQKDTKLRPQQTGANLVFLSARPETYKVSALLCVGADCGQVQKLSGHCTPPNLMACVPFVTAMLRHDVPKPERAAINPDRTLNPAPCRARQKS